MAAVAEAGGVAAHGGAVGAERAADPQRRGERGRRPEVAVVGGEDGDLDALGVGDVDGGAGDAGGAADGVVEGAGDGPLEPARAVAVPAALAGVVVAVGEGAERGGRLLLIAAAAAAAVAAVGRAAVGRAAVGRAAVAGAGVAVALVAGAHAGKSGAAVPAGGGLGDAAFDLTAGEREAGDNRAPQSQASNH